MPDTKTASFHLADALLLGLAILPWWLPLSDGQLWTSFPREALAATCFAWLAVMALARHRAAFIWPPASLLLAGLAIVPVMQCAVALVAYRGDAALAAVYLLGAAALYAIGANDRRLGTRLTSTLFTALLIAAAGAALHAIGQWLGVALPELWLASATGGRSSANLGQPNLLATLMLWGLVSIWRLDSRRRVTTTSALPGAAAIAGTATLLLGIATTQSRAGAIGVLVLAVCLVTPRVRKRTAPGASLVFWWMALAFVAVFVSWEWISAWITPTAVSALDERTTAGTRPLHWQLVWDAITQRPWAGWGWLQVSAAQSALVDHHPATGEVLQYSHNLVLDLLVWNGLPLGALLAGSLVWWLIQRVRRSDSVDALAAVAVVIVLVLHALLEFPHAYLHFLWTGALFAGFSSPPSDLPAQTPRVARFGWTALLLMAGAFGVAFVAILRDVSALQDAWHAQRFYAARIGRTTSPPPVPSVWLLDQLQARIRAEQVGATDPMSAGDVRLMERVVARYPSAGLLLRLASAKASTGDLAGAASTLQHLCKVHAATVCSAALDAWHVEAQEHPALVDVVVPEPPAGPGAPP